MPHREQDQEMGHAGSGSEVVREISPVHKLKEAAIRLWAGSFLWDVSDRLVVCCSDTCNKTFCPSTYTAWNTQETHISAPVGGSLRCLPQ